MDGGEAKVSSEDEMPAPQQRSPVKKKANNPFGRKDPSLLASPPRKRKTVFGTFSSVQASPSPSKRLGKHSSTATAARLAVNKQRGTFSTK